MDGYEWGWVTGLNGFNFALSYAAAKSASKSRAPTRFIVGLIAAISVDALIALIYIGAVFATSIWEGHATFQADIPGMVLLSAYVAIVMLTLGGAGILAGAVLGTATDSHQEI